MKPPLPGIPPRGVPPPLPRGVPGVYGRCEYCEGGNGGIPGEEGVGCSNGSAGDEIENPSGPIDID